MLREFAAYYRPHKRLFLLDFGCAVASGLLELGFPVAVKVFVDALLPSGDWGMIALAAAALLLAYLVNGGLMAVVTYWGHRLGIEIETAMRERAFAHLQTLSFAYFDRTKTGQLVGRLTKDLEEIGEVAHHGPEDLFIAVMTFVGALALMVWVSPELALLTALVLPVAVIVTARYGARLTRNWRALFARVGGFNVRIEENVGGIRVVQAFANEAHERRLFALDNARYRDTKLEGYRLMAAGTALNYLGMRLTQTAVLVAGAWLVLAGSLTPGGFVGFLLLVAVAFRPVEKINAVIETYPKGIAGFRRYLEFLATEAEVRDRPGARPAPRLSGGLRYEGVRFAYPGGPEVLRGADLAVRAGETVALVGPSGAGKTTMLSLLPRFYDVTGGRILADGADLRDLTLASLRAQVGLVQQDVFLFGGTLRENVAYGKLGAGEAEIREAVRRARLEEVAEALPLGLDTPVGERGVRLSGGQKQRLAIARAFLRDPPILLLDEATSALDAETERGIQASLAELSAGRTTLVVAHRLSTVRDADRIAVVDGGRVVEEGRHDALLRAGGAYARLHRAFEGAALREALPGGSLPPGRGGGER